MCSEATTLYRHTLFSPAARAGQPAKTPPKRHITLHHHSAPVQFFVLPCPPPVRAPDSRGCRVVLPVGAIVCDEGMTPDVSTSAMMGCQMGARSEAECGAAVLCNLESQLPLGPKTVRSATKYLMLKSPQGRWPTPLYLLVRKTVQGLGRGQTPPLHHRMLGSCGSRHSSPFLLVPWRLTQGWVQSIHPESASGTGWNGLSFFLSSILSHG